MARLRRVQPLERSRIKEILTEPKDGGPYTVWLDQQVTRRKAHHMICNSSGEVTFRSRYASDIFQWLAAEGQSRYTLCTAHGDFVVTAELAPDH